MITKLLLGGVIMATLAIQSTTTARGRVESESTIQTYYDGEFYVKIEEYRSLNSKKAVLILPPTGGTNGLDRKYAQALKNGGISAYIIEDWKDFDEFNLELEVHERFYARSQRAVDLAIKNIGVQEYGILGTSLGGLLSIIAVQRNSMISSALVIAAGVDLASIIAYSDQELMVEVKEKRYEIFGYHNEEEYISALREHIPLEPLDLVFARENKKLGVVLVEGDTTVPTVYQEELLSLWNPDFLIRQKESLLGRVLGDNHKAGIIKTSQNHLSEIINFFN